MTKSNAKVDRLLGAAVECFAASDPNRRFDVVIIPDRPDHAGQLMRLIASLGAVDAKMEKNGVLCKLQAAKVRELAESELVSRVRMARLQRMH